MPLASAQVSSLVLRGTWGTGLEYQKEPLTQVELYAALQAAGADLPNDPEAFRLWLHRVRKQGLVTKFRARQSKVARGS